MNITLHKAAPEDVETVFRIIKDRIVWMDSVGLKHWNTKGYLDVFPFEYYQEQQTRGTLYVARDSSIGEITGIVVLLDDDASWPDRLDTDAIYIHNFATDVQMTGVGRVMLTEIEKIAREKGKRYLRLDCDEENAFLNYYYQEKGFVLQEGKIRLGSYTGNRLEKDLWKSNKGINMKLERVHHIAIIVSDYEVSREFYVDKLGFEVIRENHRSDRNDWKLDLKCGEIELEIFGKSDAPARPSYPEACGLRHLAFITDNIEESVAELNAIGIDTEPIRIDEFTGKKMTFFHDPDGLPLELHE